MERRDSIDVFDIKEDSLITLPSEALGFHIQARAPSSVVGEAKDHNKHWGKPASVTLLPDREDYCCVSEWGSCQMSKQWTVVDCREPYRCTLFIGKIEQPLTIMLKGRLYGFTELPTPSV